MKPFAKLDATEMSTPDLERIVGAQMPRLPSQVEVDPDHYRDFLT